MSSEKKITRRAVLEDSGLDSVRRGHPWIFRGKLRQIPQCNPGDIVAFTDRLGDIKGWGLWSEGALSIRVLTLGRKEPNQMALLRGRLADSLRWRKKWCAGEEAFRWVHGEADGLPGIVADLYGDVLCLQVSIMGWYRHIEEVADTFRKVRKLSAVVLKNETKHLGKEGIPKETRALLGEIPAVPIRVKIGSLPQLVNVAAGQKTGAYLDVRHIPDLLAPIFCGSRVLDCFSYQGNVGLHALHHGASGVFAIEQSQGAIDIAEENLAINGLPEKMKWICGNAFDEMRKLCAGREKFDVAVVDPPPFSPGRAQLDSARRGYKELAVRAFKCLKDAGYLVFLSCSHAFTREMLLAVLNDAAMDANVACRIALEIHQPQDHPVLAAAPETDYLKGFAMEVRR